MNQLGTWRLDPMRVIFMQLACQNYYNTTHCVIQMSFCGKFTQRKILHCTKPRSPPPKQVINLIHSSQL